LRIDEKDLIKRAGGPDYMHELTTEIAALIKTQKEKKEAKKEAQEGGDGDEE
jgi:hypothetical protein